MCSSLTKKKLVYKTSLQVNKFGNAQYLNFLFYLISLSRNMKRKKTFLLLFKMKFIVGERKCLRHLIQTTNYFILKAINWHKWVSECGWEELINRIRLLFILLPALLLLLRESLKHGEKDKTKKKKHFFA